VVFLFIFSAFVIAGHILFGAKLKDDAADASVGGLVNQYTLWLFDIAMENGPFIDGLPIKDADFPWLCNK